MVLSSVMKKSKSLSRLIVPMESVLRVLPTPKDKKLLITDYDGTASVNSETDDQNLLLEHIVLGDHTLNSSNCSISNTIPDLSSSGTYIERESNESSASPLHPFKRPHNNVDGSEGKAHSSSLEHY